MTDRDELLIVTEQGQIIRMTAGDLRPIGRDTQGVRLMDLAEGDRVVSIAALTEPDDVEVGADDRRNSDEFRTPDGPLRRLEPGETREQLLRPDRREPHRDLVVVAMIFDGDDGPDAELRCRTRMPARMAGR